MLKCFALLSIALLFPTQALAAQPEPAAPPVFELGTAGVCWLYNLSGHLALDASGELVSLQPYCQQQRNWAWHEPSLFWQRFRAAANPETLRYSQKLDPDAVEAYGQTICLFFKDGGTITELTQIQADQRFPASFEQAVTVASVESLCKEYRDLYRQRPASLHQRAL